MLQEYVTYLQIINTVCFRAIWGMLVVSVSHDGQTEESKADTKLFRQVKVFHFKAIRVLRLTWPLWRPSSLLSPRVIGLHASVAVSDVSTMTERGIEETSNTQTNHSTFTCTSLSCLSLGGPWRYPFAVWNTFGYLRHVFFLFFVF